MKLTDRLGGRGERPRDPRDPRRRAGEDGLDLQGLMKVLHSEVIDRLNLARVSELEPEALRQHICVVVQHVAQQRGMALNDSQLERIAASIVDEIVGLGPLEQLLSDPTVSDILVNTAEHIFVERGGVLERTNVRFRDNAHLLNTINRIVARIGRRIDEASPMVDARLPDGSRVNAVIPPLAIDGPLLSIRRFGTGPITPEELAKRGAFTPAMGQYLRCAVHAECNILVAGGTGAGKTTLLNALSSFIPPNERIVTIEDSAELCLQQEHVARLETRPPNIEGRGEVTIRDLVKNALRMRPDRIIVGEVRSSEVLDMIQAMNTGHEGSLTTVHANSAEDSLVRLVTMLGMAGTKLSESMMQQMIARAIHLIVFVSRLTDGTRRVTSVAELGGASDGEIRLNEVFRYEQRGVDARGRVDGYFACSGRSLLLNRFAEAGVPLHPSCLSGSR